MVTDRELDKFAHAIEHSISRFQSELDERRVPPPRPNKYANMPERAAGVIDQDVLEDNYAG